MEELSYLAYVNIGKEYTPFLEHHGILGQKWGVRRYQNPDGTLTEAGKERYGDDGGGRQSLKDKWNSLDPKTKTKIKVGVAVAGTALAAYGVYKFSGAFDPSRDPLYDAASGFIKQEHVGDPSLEPIAVNPKAVTNSPRYLNNCSHCSATYELRRRGFNVTASPGLGERQSVIDKFFKNAEKKDVAATLDTGEKLLSPFDLPDKRTIIPDKQTMEFVKDQKKYLTYCQNLKKKNPIEFAIAQGKHAKGVVDTCESFGPNARGHISLFLSNGGGHSFQFENDAEGKVKFIDSQLASNLGLHSTVSREGGLYFKQIVADNNPFMPTRITRTDNAVPDYDFLRKRNIVLNPKVYRPEIGDKIALGVGAVGATAAAGSALSIRSDAKKTRPNNPQKEMKAIRKYRLAHPNTKMSDEEIIESLWG